IAGGRIRSCAALCLVLCAHLAVFAELGSWPGPDVLEKLPEPLMVGFVSAPEVASEQRKASSTIKHNSLESAKPEVTQQKSARNRSTRRPAIHQMRVHDPIDAPRRTTRDSGVPRPAEKFMPRVSEAGSQPAPLSAGPAMSQSASGAASDQPASFDAAYLHNPAPEYPAISRRLGEQGLVLLSVTVTADGGAGSVAVQTSSGWSRLDQAALKCVQNWRFVPAIRDGQAVDASVIVPVRFSIEG
ncbi:MAG: energy transducer TonB, partial [Methylococcaceae bacterium]|nr:energy transducer TonB [Methylococcaceae bacterium]